MTASGLCVAASRALTRLDEDRVIAHITSSSLLDLVGSFGGGLGAVMIASPKSSGRGALWGSLLTSFVTGGIVARGGGKNVYARYVTSFENVTESRRFDGSVSVMCLWEYSGGFFGGGGKESIALASGVV